jgi:DnaK suppressor protein
MQRKAKVKATTAKTKTTAKKATKPAAKAATKTAAKPALKKTTKIAAKTSTKSPRGMTKLQTKGYKKLLLSEKQELAEAYNKNKNYGRTTDDEGSQDLADKASNSYTKEFLYSLSNTDREVLQKVDDALIRIAKGSFGVCVECGDSLNKKRLEAVPWASHCLPCQEKVERGLL